LAISETLYKYFFGLLTHVMLKMLMLTAFSGLSVHCAMRWNMCFLSEDITCVMSISHDQASGTDACRNPSNI